MRIGALSAATTEEEPRATTSSQSDQQQMHDQVGESSTRQAVNSNSSSSNNDDDHGMEAVATTPPGEDRCTGGAGTGVAPDAEVQHDDELGEQLSSPQEESAAAAAAPVAANAMASIANSEEPTLTAESGVAGGNVAPPATNRLELRCQGKEKGSATKKAAAGGGGGSAGAGAGACADAGAGAAGPPDAAGSDGVKPDSIVLKKGKGKRPRAGKSHKRGRQEEEDEVREERIGRERRGECGVVVGAGCCVVWVCRSACSFLSCCLIDFDNTYIGLCVH